ncbi:hypothetical protein FB451DRAFT_1468812 [Mycena latifolia]|nr:hypothetical protein FB451DRAFT_1468812 [Mycena latifolia]
MPLRLADLRAGGQNDARPNLKRLIPFPCSSAIIRRPFSYRSTSLALTLTPRCIPRAESARISIPALHGFPPFRCLTSASLASPRPQHWFESPALLPTPSLLYAPAPRRSSRWRPKRRPSQSETVHSVSLFICNYSPPILVPLDIARHRSPSL